MTKPLQIYNNLNKQKNLFQPLSPGHIKLYVCGMTVYDYCHIGHGRILVVFDVIVRYLRYLGYTVNYVRNITDIDDKIIQRALENRENWEDLTARFIKAMTEDEAALQIIPPTSQPQATHYVDKMINMIQVLIHKNFAYQASNGDVYYDVGKFKPYGQLAHQDLESLQAGSRVEVDAAKQGPLDFVLWKQAKPQEPCWDSPWGQGRPGWHIECATMATDLLGSPIDIHGGGLDLQFPHHQNELAQAEAACDCPFVNNWMHVGYVQVNHEKMSKSLGNFFTLREILGQYNPETVRYFLAASHYRSPINYTEEHLNNAQQALERFYIALRHLSQEEIAEQGGGNYEERFKEKMNDDFNTPEALGVLFDLARNINKLREQGKIQEAAQLGKTLKRLGGILGFLQQNPEEFLQTNPSSDTQQAIDALVAQRNQARQNRDWPEADRLRKKLDAMGVTLEDTADGKTHWKKRRLTNEESKPAT